MLERIERGALDDAQLAVVEVGLHHEQQHQELVLTDIKHGFSCNPLRPAYREAPVVGVVGEAPPARWLTYDGGIRQIGHGGAGFAFDNERPRHDVLERPFALASHLVTCGEYLEFIADGGYTRPELWLSAGWHTMQSQGWSAPLYWEQHDDAWQIFTLHGMRPLDPATPVCHVSLYEADAFARWRGARLPTEAQWELAAAEVDVDGNFVDHDLERSALHPVPAEAGPGLRQAFGDVWEWTASAYAPYPGFRPLAGALGEYNGKFMCNQLVLRGGSCATPADHVRASYRNFFPPEARWQFSGIRLAEDR
jgi:ergothioneine biosynthesis protein EgtB